MIAFILRQHTRKPPCEQDGSQVWTYKQVFFLALPKGLMQPGTTTLRDQTPFLALFL